MSDSNDSARRLLAGLHGLLPDDSALHFSEFVEVSESFIAGYSRFVRLGVPAETIGLAMLGATINVYNMFGVSNELPNLFRVLADKIEEEGQPN